MNANFYRIREDVARKGLRRLMPVALAAAFICGSLSDRLQAGVLDELTRSVGLYDRPILIVDNGPHTDSISALEVDKSGRFLVSASFDKSVKVWSVDKGSLLKTIYLPNGPDHIGEAWATSISPDGLLIAAAGWTAAGFADESIYIFDRVSGQMVQRIRGLPNVVYDLGFSPDGSTIAVALAGNSGVRLFDVKTGKLIAAEQNYGDEVDGIVFSGTGELATTSRDNKLRLYDPALRIIAEIKLPDKCPCRIQFSPNSDRMLISYTAITDIDVLKVDTDARPLTQLKVVNRLIMPEDKNAKFRQDPSSIEWSQDGGTIYVVGNWKGARLCRWREDGKEPIDCAPSSEWVTEIVRLSDGRLAFSAKGPKLGVFDLNLKQIWTSTSIKIDNKTVNRNIVSSYDGADVKFTFNDGTTTVYSVPALKFQSEVDGDKFPVTPTQNLEIKVENWENNSHPMLGGKPIALSTYEVSRSLAISADRRHFALGTDAALRFFDGAGAAVWSMPASSPVWGLSMSGDGRLIIAAYDDGTFRWHRAEDGAVLFSFLPFADKANWLIWTSEGFYEGTPLGLTALKWLVNHGRDTAPTILSADMFASLRRPDVFPSLLQTLDVVRSVGLTDIIAARSAIQRENRSDTPPGAHLHVISVGISKYQVPGLRPRNAALDAFDLASAFRKTQRGLFADVSVQVLLDEAATRSAILSALDSVKNEMRSGDGKDLTVFAFSGQATKVGDKVYLIPYNADDNDGTSDRVSSISVNELSGYISKLGREGRVLFLLDTCDNGTNKGAPVDISSKSFRDLVGKSKVSIITNSQGSELSYGDDIVSHSAFTESVIEALHSQGDKSNGEFVSVEKLAEYVSERVKSLSNGKQHPTFSVYDKDFFATER